ncbi:MAG: hypothetical protein K0S33_878 [Bacteroidetes bacterium]|jgi:hypothetical protein|nr:hypothetical protein [Bacteroidota bacterium]
MKRTGIFIFLLAATALLSFSFINATLFPEHLKNTQIAKLKETDSLVYYQCRTESVKAQDLYTEDGKKIEMKAKKQFVTITEKFKLYKTGTVYRLQYFDSPTTWYPNKKYAYLKLTEKPYWEFKLKLDTILPEEDVLRLAAYETKLRSITEYDFRVLEDNSPQLIINGKKISEQFCVTEKIVLSSALSVFKNGKK